MRIRKARPEDAKEITQLVRDTIKKVNAADYTEEQIRAWAPTNKTNKYEQMIQEGRKIWVAVEDSEIVGMATLKTHKNEVGGFYIKHNRIGTGIGKKLNERIEKEAKKEGINELKLWSTTTAALFYQKRGYKKIRNSYVEMNNVKVPVVIMKKKL